LRFGYLIEMHILQESESTQSIVIVPRSYPGSVTLQLIDESTNTTATPSVSVSSADGFMTISGTFSVKNGRFYGLKVLDGSTLIYRDRVFVTAQTNFDKYTVNQGAYIEDNSYDNEFVII
jgi:hypothetical protein